MLWDVCTLWRSFAVFGVINRWMVNSQVGETSRISGQREEEGESIHEGDTRTHGNKTGGTRWNRSKAMW